MELTVVGWCEVPAGLSPCPRASFSSQSTANAKALIQGVFPALNYLHLPGVYTVMCQVLSVSECSDQLLCT